MKKSLIIFDLNHTLLYAAKNNRVKTFDYNDKILNKKPDYTVDSHKIYSRPGRIEFLDFLFLKNKDYFEIGVWSS